MAAGRVSEVDPRKAWEILAKDQDAVLVDVRSRAEWTFTGTPDLAPIAKQVVLAEWQRFPGMVANEGFVPELRRALGRVPARILFLCRSGARSMAAARAVAAGLGSERPDLECINVAEGFEGGLDAGGHRGGESGWKARGLAWRQS
jgi:rhodanese-related sulfurtransferase